MLFLLNDKEKVERIQHHFQQIMETLETQDVIVIVQAKHLCVSSRGIKDKNSFTTTVEYGGRFKEERLRNEFYGLLKNGHKE